MKGLTTFVASVAAVIGLGSSGLHAIEAQLGKLVPGISMPRLPSTVPSFKRAPTQAPVAAPVPAPATEAGEASKAKALVDSPLGKATAVGAGIAVSELVVPLQMNKSGECYTETIDGIQHVPCDQAKGGAK